MNTSGYPANINIISSAAEVIASNQEEFLKTLRETGNASRACRNSGFTRSQINKMRKENEDFAASYADAIDEAADLLEAEAWRRAIDGVSQPLLKSGQVVLDPATGKPMTVQRYSDPLLVMLLRGNKPGKFLQRVTTPLSIDAGAVLQEIAADNDPPRSGVA